MKLVLYICGFISIGWAIFIVVFFAGWFVALIICSIIECFKFFKEVLVVKFFDFLKDFQNKDIYIPKYIKELGYENNWLKNRNLRKQSYKKAKQIYKQELKNR